ncbi:hypothetical protein SCD92_18870, partial [Gilvimarinus sp. SDUM040013]
VIEIPLLFSFYQIVYRNRRRADYFDYLDRPYCPTYVCIVSVTCESLAPFLMVLVEQWQNGLPL